MGTKFGISSLSMSRFLKCLKPCLYPGFSKLNFLPKMLLGTKKILMQSMMGIGEGLMGWDFFFLSVYAWINKIWIWLWIILMLKMMNWIVKCFQGSSRPKNWRIVNHLELCSNFCFKFSLLILGMISNDKCGIKKKICKLAF